MIDEEIKKLNEEFKNRSKKITEQYEKNPLRDGYNKEHIALRRWYENELKRIHEQFSQTA